MTRAEVNRQVEEALASAHASSSSASASQAEASPAAALFKGLGFFLSRESQYAWLEFAIVAAGGRVGWAGCASLDLDDPAVTHVVYDRPTAPQRTRQGVEYVQPQWVADALNAKLLLPLERYRPGASLPPHLSPFVDDAKEGYVPAYRAELALLKSAAEEYGNLGGGGGAGLLEAGSAEAGLPQGEEGAAPEDEEEGDDEEGDGEEEEDGDEDAEDEEDSEDEVDEREEGDDDGDEEEDDEGSAQGKPSRSAPAAAAVSEEKALALVMMNKKAKRLYDRMQHGLAAKSGKVDALKRKRAAADKQAAAKPAAKPAPQPSAKPAPQPAAKAPKSKK